MTQTIEQRKQLKNFMVDKKNVTTFNPPAIKYSSLEQEKLDKKEEIFCIVCLACGVIGLLVMTIWTVLQNL